MDSNISSYNSRYTYMITAVATLGGLLFGFDSGVINGTVEGLQQAFDSNSIGTGFNVASMLLGCAVGAYFAGSLADRFGRRRILFVASVMFIISAFGSGIASFSLEFIVYRIIGGLAVGAASVMTPAYISEIVPAHLRGRLSSTQQIAIISGLFFAFLSNYVIAQVSSSTVAEFWLGYEAWRWMFWIEIIPASIFFIGLFFIPESPRYFAIQNENEKAEHVLAKIFALDVAKAKVEEIKQSLLEEKAELNSASSAFNSKFKRIIWVGIGLAVFQQLVGINVVFYYGAVLWQAVGFTESDALLINVISGLVSILSIFVSILMIDKIGRKPLLMYGSIGMTITLAGVSFAFFNGHIDPTSGSLVLGDTWGLVALISANLYVAFFNASWGPVMWVLLGEMFPNKLRGRGLAISGLAQWIANFSITISFPVFLSMIGLTATYSIYMIFSALSIFFVVKMVRETKGIELEKMHALWENN